MRCCRDGSLDVDEIQAAVAGYIHRGNSFEADSLERTTKPTATKPTAAAAPRSRRPQRRSGQPVTSTGLVSSLRKQARTTGRKSAPTGPTHARKARKMPLDTRLVKPLKPRRAVKRQPVGTPSKPSQENAASVCFTSAALSSLSPTSSLEHTSAHPASLPSPVSSEALPRSPLASSPRYWSPGECSHSRSPSCSHDSSLRSELTEDDMVQIAKHSATVHCHSPQAREESAGYTPPQEERALARAAAQEGTATWEVLPQLASWLTSEDAPSSVSAADMNGSPSTQVVSSPAETEDYSVLAELLAQASAHESPVAQAEPCKLDAMSGSTTPPLSFNHWCGSGCAVQLMCCRGVPGIQAAVNGCLHQRDCEADNVNNRCSSMWCV